MNEDDHLINLNEYNKTISKEIKRHIIKSSSIKRTLEIDSEHEDNIIESDSKSLNAQNNSSN